MVGKVDIKTYPLIRYMILNKFILGSVQPLINKLLGLKAQYFRNRSLY